MRCTAGSFPCWLSIRFPGGTARTGPEIRFSDGLGHIGQFEVASINAYDLIKSTIGAVAGISEQPSPRPVPGVFSSQLPISGCHCSPYEHYGPFPAHWRHFMTQSKNYSHVAVDPVCGMRLEKDRCEFESTYEARRYCFCADACRSAFEKDPLKYLLRSNGKPQSAWRRYLARLNKITGGKPPGCCH
jgi:YHS domain-containing protein